MAGRADHRRRNGTAEFDPVGACEGLERLEAPEEAKAVNDGIGSLPLFLAVRYATKAAQSLYLIALF